LAVGSGNVARQIFAVSFAAAVGKILCPAAFQLAVVRLFAVGVLLPSIQVRLSLPSLPRLAITMAVPSRLQPAWASAVVQQILQLVKMCLDGLKVVVRCTLAQVVPQRRQVRLCGIRRRFLISCCHFICWCNGRLPYASEGI